MRPIRLIAIVVLAAASVLLANPALADTHREGKHGNGHGRHHGRLHLQVGAMTCIGDTFSATVTGSGPAGTVLTIRPVALGRDHRVTVGSASSVVTLPLPAGGAHVQLDVAAMRARAYQVAVYTGRDRVARSNAVPAGSCAPGHEVPEAPVALLAPLTMLGTVALGAWRLRVPARKVA